MAAKAEKKSPKLKQHDINAVFDILSGIMPEPKQS